MPVKDANKLFQYYKDQYFIKQSKMDTKSQAKVLQKKWVGVLELIFIK